MTSIVFLHGLLGGAATWRDVIARVDAPCVELTLPGHGCPPRTSARDFDDAIHAIARELPPRSLLVGYSLGARIALGIALRHAPRAIGAVLIGVDPGIDDPAELTARAALDDARADSVRGRGLAAFVDDWQALPLFATQAALPPALRARVRAERLAHDRDGIAWALRVLGVGRMPNMWRALASCAIPLRAIAGARDDKFGAIAKRIAAIAPRAHVCIATGAGHNVALEAPDIVADEIRAALHEQELAA